MSPAPKRSRPISRATPIANSRLIAAGANGVTFTYKDYRVEGPERYKVMTLAPHEFIRRFLLHVLPKEFHCIRQIPLYIIVFK
jgi:hypothetical protein